MTHLALRPDQVVEVHRILDGSLAPIHGFMTEQEGVSVIESMRLPTGEVVGLPVLLDVSPEVARRCAEGDILDLRHDAHSVATLRVESVYKLNAKLLTQRVFGTGDMEHPGVARQSRMGQWALGGRLEASTEVPNDGFGSLGPAEIRSAIRARGWKTTAGFQTRNIPHRAHELLHRQALDACDGLLIHPLVGARKSGDFTPEAVMAAYHTLVTRHLPPTRVLLAPIRLTMRYAGPREAVFHAVVRRNYGCSHFIVGRDHAGVGSYYAPYAAHDLLRAVEADLGIAILYMRGPAYCSRCARIVTDVTCDHFVSAPDAIEEVSGTWLRRHIQEGVPVPDHLVRSDVLKALDGLPVFLTESDAY